MKIRLIIFIVIVLFTFWECRKNDKGPVNGSNSLRISGYHYSEDSWNAVQGMDLTQLTDLNLAFINPDTAGEVFLNNSVQSVIDKAHQNNVRVYISLGGAAAPEHVGDVLKFKRTRFVNNLLNLVTTYNLDGIDVDLEGTLIDENYGHLIKELSEGLKLRSKNLTAALATWNGNIIHDTTLQRFDHINVMSYDHTGPWDTSNPGQHSSYEDAYNDLKFYIQQRNIDPLKILLGVPFYGYQFGQNEVSAFTYAEIVANFPGAESMDVVDRPGDGKIFYNGIPTMKRKVELAKELGIAGIMIWEITQDAAGDKSLLRTINAGR